ncbi:MAG: hypothetical protein BroJett014_04790 [Planctomycetota bacterium]|nr:MAG: hypothetical protein BroJett014_04790 [Planctomycetota bacterium]
MFTWLGCSGGLVTGAVSVQTHIWRGWRLEGAVAVGGVKHHRGGETIPLSQESCNKALWAAPFIT